MTVGITRYQITVTMIQRYNAHIQQQATSQSRSSKPPPGEYAWEESRRTKKMRVDDGYRSAEPWRIHAAVCLARWPRSNLVQIFQMAADVHHILYDMSDENEWL